MFTSRKPQPVRRHFALHRRVITAATALLVSLSMLAVAVPATAGSEVGTCISGALNIDGGTIGATDSCTVLPGELVFYDIVGGKGGDNAYYADKFDGFEGSDGFAGSAGGRGARITGTYANEGTVPVTLYIRVGADGVDGAKSGPIGARGGGYSSISTADDFAIEHALVIAGGGGGAGMSLDPGVEGGNADPFGSAGAGAGGQMSYDLGSAPGLAGGTTNTAGASGKVAADGNGFHDGGSGGAAGEYGASSYYGGYGGAGYVDTRFGGTTGSTGGGGGAGYAGGGGGIGAGFGSDVGGGGGGGSSLLTGDATPAASSGQGASISISSPPVRVQSVSPAHGALAGGTAVTITGIGFQAGAVVTIDGAAATEVVVVSATEITARTPAGTSGAADVRVSNVNAQHMTGRALFYYADGDVGTCISDSTRLFGGADGVTHTCTVLAGEVIAFDVEGGKGGDDEYASHEPGNYSAGGYGARIVGTYRNAETHTVTLYLRAGADGVDGVSDDSGFRNGGAGGGYTSISTTADFDSTTVLVIAGGGGGAGGVTSGANGGASDPASPVGAGNGGADTGGLEGRAPGAVGGTGSAPGLGGVSAADGSGWWDGGAGGAPGSLGTSTPFGAEGGAGFADTLYGGAARTGGGAGGGGSGYAGGGAGAGVDDDYLSGSGGGAGSSLLRGDATAAPGGARGASRIVITRPVLSVSPATGALLGGTPLQISGHGFLFGAQVTIGGASATEITVVSPTLITATSPAGVAGVAEVAVTNPGTVSTTGIGRFTYLPGPGVSSISPTSGSWVGGTPITITGTDFAQGASVTVGGSPVTDLVVESATSITARTPAGDLGAADVVVTNPDGQGTSASFTYVSDGAVGTCLSSVARFGGLTGATDSCTVLPGEFVSYDVEGGKGGNDYAYADRLGGPYASQYSAGGLGARIVGSFLNSGTKPVTLYMRLGADGADGDSVRSGGRGGGYTSISLVDDFVTSHALVVAGGGGGAGGYGLGAAGGAANPASAGGAGNGGASTDRYFARNPGMIGGSTNLAGGGGLGGNPCNYYCGGDGGAPGSAGVGTTYGAFGGSGYSDTRFGGQASDNGGAAGGGGAGYAGGGGGGEAGGGFGGGGGAGSSLLNGSSVPAFDPAQGASRVSFSAAVLSVRRVNPIGGPLAGGTLVTIQGSAFRDGATITFGGVAATDVLWVNFSTLTARTPGGTGTVDVVVTNPGNESATGTSLFTYAPAPSISGLTPVNGPTGGQTPVTIVGTGFTALATVTIGGSFATSVVVVDSATITARTPVGTVGTADVVVTNPDGQSDTKTAAFTYVAPPVVGGISPDSGPVSGGRSVSVYGTGFTSDATVTIGGVAATSVQWINAGLISAATPAGTAGTADVVVTNGDGQSDTKTAAFTYIAAPTVTGISRATGPTVGGTAVTITGTGFQTGATVTFGGSAATSVVVVGADTITAVTPAGSAGLVDVVVGNPDNQTGTGIGRFTYLAAPTIASISPAFGGTVGGTAVTISGTDFRAGVTVKIGGVTATNVAFVDSATITARTPAGPVGAANVVVTNTDSQTVTGVAMFMYYAAPTISAVGPARGTVLGGTAVTITGSGFRAGATVKIGGVAATGVVVDSATSITAVTPAGIAGTASVSVTNADSQTATAAAVFTYVTEYAATSVTAARAKTITVTWAPIAGMVTKVVISNGATSYSSSMLSASGSWSKKVALGTWTVTIYGGTTRGATTTVLYTKSGL